MPTAILIDHNYHLQCLHYINLKKGEKAAYKQAENKINEPKELSFRILYKSPS
jgi:hypothetical protein